MCRYVIYDELRLVDIRGIVAGVHSDAESLEPGSERGKVQVGSGDRVPAMAQHLSDARHVYSAHTDEVHALRDGSHKRLLHGCVPSASSSTSAAIRRAASGWARRSAASRIARKRS